MWMEREGCNRLIKNVSPKYYALIETFRKKTGVPILLNTSFNENEPIVNTPEEALVCYLRTQMDMLAIENILIKENRQNSHAGLAINLYYCTGFVKKCCAI